MPSSGKGNSHDTDYKKCEQYFFRKHRQNYSAREALVAPPLLIGEAIHKYAEVFINAWMHNARDYKEMCQEALHAFDSIVGSPNPDDIEMLERETLARTVLPLWAMRKYKRLDSGIEIPVATELHLTMKLPEQTPYGPIILPLRQYTAKLDYVYVEGDTKYPVNSDHKGTKASSPEKESKHYLMSDQHIGYAACFNGLWTANTTAKVEEGSTVDWKLIDGKPLAKIEYDFTRLHKNVTSEFTFHRETRNISQDMIDDWYQRMLALRAEMSRKWDKPREVWIMNTSPHGPCLGMDGRSCEYLKLCQRPWDADALLANQYVKEGI